MIFDNYVGTRIDNELLERLLAQSKILQRPISELLRISIIRFLKEEEERQKYVVDEEEEKNE